MDLVPQVFNMMGIEEYVDKCEKLTMNLIIAESHDIEYYDEISEFIEDAKHIVSSGIEEDIENNRKRKTLIKFFEEFNIGYDGNIFLEKTGTEIWIKLQELYQEVLNEEESEVE